MVGSSLIALLVALCGPPTSTAASLRPLTQPIPEGVLAGSLERLSNHTGLLVLYDPRLINGIHAPRIEPTNSVLLALSRLLEQSGLAFEQTGPDSVAIVRKQFVDGLAHSETPPATPQLPEVIVTAERKRINVPTSAESAMRHPTSLMEVPASVAVIDDKRIQELAADRFENVLTYLSDVEAIPSGISSIAFLFRGFINLQYYLDGVRISPDLYQGGFRDLSNIETIEVLKGPSSILFGRGAPGGAINLVPKEPARHVSESMDIEWGSFNFKRATFDVNLPLTYAPAGFRLNGAYESSSSYREYQTNHRTFLAPSFFWQPTPSVLLTLRAEFLSAVDADDLGQPTVGQVLPDVPRSRNLLGANSVIHTEDRRISARSDIVLDERWRWRQKIDIDWQRTPEPSQYGFTLQKVDPGSCTLQSCPIGRFLYSVPRCIGKTLYASEQLSGHTNWFGLANSLDVGTEFFQASLDFNFFAVFSRSFAIDLYNPVQIPVQADKLAYPHERYSEFELQRWAAAYAEDRLQLSKHWNLLVGAREDIAWQNLHYEYVTVAAAASVDSNDPRIASLTPRFALQYEPSESFSVYGSYTESLGLSNGRTAGGFGGTGAPLPPESARQWEFGGKWAWTGGSPNVTIAFFDVRKEHVAVPDPNPARAVLGIFSTAGMARSRGVELTLSTAVGRSWNLRAAMAYTSAKIFGNVLIPSDAGGYEVRASARTSYGVPNVLANAWVTYQPGQAWTLGTGVTARGPRFGDNQNDYRLREYTLWSVMASRRWDLKAGSLTAQLNVDNVSDTYYAESSLGTHYVLPGAPRTWRLGVRFER